MPKKHILKEIVPHGFDTSIEEIQEKNRQAIKEKDAALALLTDHLQDRDNQIQAIPYENVVLQALKDVYQAELQKFQNTNKIPKIR